MLLTSLQLKDPPRRVSWCVYYSFILRGLLNPEGLFLILLSLFIFPRSLDKCSNSLLILASLIALIGIVICCCEVVWGLAKCRLFRNGKVALAECRGVYCQEIEKFEVVKQLLCRGMAFSVIHLCIKLIFAAIVHSDRFNNFKNQNLFIVYLDYMDSDGVQREVVRSVGNPRQLTDDDYELVFYSPRKPDSVAVPDVFHGNISINEGGDIFMSWRYPLFQSLSVGVVFIVAELIVLFNDNIFEIFKWL